jgi:alkanesulfonate monooxygenase SsuD/methylene tetrahydromethanopterin reductase-like flavin-dependent oxidoreductase (luciferase family)
MPENLDGIMLNGLELSNSKNRKEYTAEFLHKLLNDVQMIDGIEMPEILVSGDSDESIYLAKKTSNIIAVTYESFMKDPTRVTKHGFEKIFLYLSVLVTDTDEEAKIEIDSISESEKVLNGSPFYGSKETLTDKIIELQSMGITDIFFSQFDRNHDREPVHSFLSELTNKGILS